MISVIDIWISMMINLLGYGGYSRWRHLSVLQLFADISQLILVTLWWKTADTGLICHGETLPPSPLPTHSPNTLPPVSVTSSCCSCYLSNPKIRFSCAVLNVDTDRKHKTRKIARELICVSWHWGEKVENKLVDKWRETKVSTSAKVKKGSKVIISRFFATLTGRDFATLQNTCWAYWTGVLLSVSNEHLIR